MITREGRTRAGRPVGARGAFGDTGRPRRAVAQLAETEQPNGQKP